MAEAISDNKQPIQCVLWPRVHSAALFVPHFLTISLSSLRWPARIGKLPLPAGTSKGDGSMKHRNVVLATLAAVGLFLGGVVSARRANSVDPVIHPNLAEAQQQIQEAVKKIHEAHEVDRDDLGGHAEKAIHPLDEANMEVKSAAE